MIELAKEKVRRADAIELAKEEVRRAAEHAKCVEKECSGLMKRVQDVEAKMEADRKDREETSRNMQLQAEADRRGRDLVMAAQRLDRVVVEELLGAANVSFDMVDDTGMSALHHAARLVKREWVTQLLEKAPSTVNVVTHYARTPSSWTVLNCAADVPKRKNHSELTDHIAVCRALVVAASKQTIANITGFGTTAFHQFAARGHEEVLQEILPLVKEKIGAVELKRVLNIKVGQKELGTVDTALRSSSGPRNKSLRRRRGRRAAAGTSTTASTSAATTNLSTDGGGTSASSTWCC